MGNLCLALHVPRYVGFLMIPALACAPVRWRCSCQAAKRVGFLSIRKAVPLWYTVSVLVDDAVPLRFCVFNVRQHDGEVDVCTEAYCIGMEAQLHAKYSA